MALSQAEATTVVDLDRIARQFAGLLRPGMRVGLRGALGAGKTTFVKGLAKVLGVVDDVLSPTYLYHQSYSIHLPNGEPSTMHHLDLYRLQSADDVAALDLQVADPDGIVIIEWIDRVPELARAVDVVVSFAVVNGKRLLNFDWVKA